MILVDLQKIQVIQNKRIYNEVEIIGTFNNIKDINKHLNQKVFIPNNIIINEEVYKELIQELKSKLKQKKSFVAQFLVETDKEKYTLQFKFNKIKNLSEE